jgi:hypothetical protein
MRGAVNDAGDEGDRRERRSYALAPMVLYQHGARACANPGGGRAGHQPRAVWFRAGWPGWEASEG